ncbi:DUF4019 domain-containing protein [Nitrosomonas oligotropha]|jgi:hypothetical protein|uniref:DUF4019 domain-containing protein n=1 Tax=Nitrosomonas oligotropha TaxID=42354 RepID=UPI000D4D4D37|nr:DUF4019 domain-containing protein [Nitrosomonas oligotropha]MXS82806.1 DUF4019 domain-containing protein [Nitrosomonas oligotropha]
MKRFIMVLLLLFCTGTGYAQEDNILEKVESSARAWLKLVDSGDYKDSWENASPLFKGKTSEGAWIKSITAIRAPRGAMNARYIATAGATKSLSGFPDGEYIVLQFYTTFGEKGLALETITLAKAKDDTWQIADYESK